MFPRDALNKAVIGGRYIAWRKRLIQACNHTTAFQKAKLRLSVTAGYQQSVNPEPPRPQHDPLHDLGLELTGVNMRQANFLSNSKHLPFSHHNGDVLRTVAGPVPLIMEQKMEATNYAVEAQIEASHWWFVGRRRLFRRLITDFHISREAPIADIGTSTGTNLRLLREMGFTNVMGIDASEESIRYCREKGLGEVLKGDICKLDFARGTFALVLATDIIEHVDDDVAALHELARILKPAGRVLITVPTFPALWGCQDEVAHHKRRYQKLELEEKIAMTGLVVEDIFYFNYILFVPIWFARRVMKLLDVSVASEAEVNSPLLNRLFLALFALDVDTAQRVNPPFGVSALAIARKK